jgi:hypothetical protein
MSVSPEAPCKGERGPWWLRLDPFLLLVVALGFFFGAVAGWHFLQHSRLLWDHPLHDRNAHYLTGQVLALSIQQGNFAELLHQLDNMRVWGPLHGFLLAGLFLVAGPDYRLAVLPSLIGYVAAGILAFCIVRRCLRDGGAWGGLFTALCFWASPLCAALATDVMLENPGVCLILLIVYLYLRTVQDGSARACRWLCVALTLLFLLKYNFWVIALGGIGLVDMARRSGFYLDILAKLRPTPSLSAWLLGNVRRPLLWIAFLALGGVFALHLTGGGTMAAGRFSISLQSPHNLLQVAWIALFVEVVLRLRTASGNAWLAEMPASVSTFLGWHVLPASMYFLLPKRLGYFFWFLSPGNSETTIEYPPGLTVLNETLSTFYMPGAWGAILLLGLFAVGLWGLRKASAGSSAVFVLFLLGAALFIMHPNRKFRYVYSFVPFLMLGAGVGFAWLLNLLGRWQAGRLRPALGTLTLAGFGALLLPHWIDPPATPMAGVNSAGASTLDVSDAYLPHLEGTQRTLLVSNIDARFYLRWTFLERYRGLKRVLLVLPPLGDDAEANRETFRRWLERSGCDSVVLVQVEDGSPFGGLGDTKGADKLPQLLAEAPGFRPVLDREAPHSCRVTLWRRQDTQTAQRQSP